MSEIIEYEQVTVFDTRSPSIVSDGVTQRWAAFERVSGVAFEAEDLGGPWRYVAFARVEVQKGAMISSGDGDLPAGLADAMAAHGKEVRPTTATWGEVRHAALCVHRLMRESEECGNLHVIVADDNIEDQWIRSAKANLDAGITDTDTPWTRAEIETLAALDRLDVEQRWCAITLGKLWRQPGEAEEMSPGSLPSPDEPRTGGTA